VLKLTKNSTFDFRIEPKGTPSTRKRVMDQLERGMHVFNNIFRTPGHKNQREAPKVLSEKVSFAILTISTISNNYFK